MRQFFSTALNQSLLQQAPATGIGLFRCLYGLVVLQEIIFLFYFNALIFDPVPFIEAGYPLIPFFLGLWGITAICLTIGWHCQFATIANYCFWVIFVSFTPMRHEFDGGFDQFMTGIGLLLIILPVNRKFALDNLRLKLRQTKFASLKLQPTQVSIFAYYLPVVICLGFLYFDSALHKLFAEHWRNGLGGWLPSTLPYYVSALDMSWLLNIKPLQMLLGYSIFVFQFSFLLLIFNQRGRIALLFAGIALHLGITLSLNIYPFGIGMLICYVLLIPFSWWRKLSKLLTCHSTSLTLYYDADSIIANRTSIFIDHFDVFNTIDIKPRQNNQTFDWQKYQFCHFIVIDQHEQIHTDFNAWTRVLIHMRYSAILGWLLKIPGIRQLAHKRYQANLHNKFKRYQQTEITEDQVELLFPYSFYDRIFEQYAQKKPKRFKHYLHKVLLLILILQLNSTLHYAVAYRLNQNLDFGSLFAPLVTASNSLLVLTHTFLGITPHALYLHDHFAGYDQILAITYIDKQGQEQWLPFINKEGRLIAPNWGRVQSMWANVAVTPNIDPHRLKKYIMKVSAFWGTKIGLDLDHATFIIKHKNISTPFIWEDDLRKKNLQGEWQNVGIASWENFRFSCSFSAKFMQKEVDFFVDPSIKGK